MSASPPSPTAWQHPGFSRRKTRTTPKGRQTTPEALQELKHLLGSDKLERTLLIEYLHTLQDDRGFLPASLLAALAERLGCALVEVFEVASFYAHFNIVKDEVEPAPSHTAPKVLTLRVCDSISCAIAGAEQLLASLEQEKKNPSFQVRILRAPCMGRCDKAPVAMLGKKALESASVESLKALLADNPPDTTAELPSAPLGNFALARKEGRYATLLRCLQGEWSREQVLETVAQAGLCGLGGAGFPAARKWQTVLACAKPRLMAVNADEGEPGTFKDHLYLSQDLHRILEGMLIAAWLVEAEKIWFYLRDEYPDIYALLQRELPLLRAAGFSFAPDIFLRRGAGAYICGEESAMLESIEGKRGLPRHKPPFPAQVGLFGRPTLIHNVETLYWIPQILDKGAEWYATQGADSLDGKEKNKEKNNHKNNHKGWRSYSVSGRVKHPGVKLAPAGITLRELLEKHCGGMAEGHRLLGYLPGGASGGMLNAEQIDLPLDFGTLVAEGCFVGSYAVVVFSDHDDPAALVRNLMRFFEEESCGQCTPCRVGTEKAVGLLASKEWDRDLLEELCSAMADASICGLGQAAGNPVRCLLKNFSAHVPQKH